MLQAEPLEFVWCFARREHGPSPGLQTQPQDARPCPCKPISHEAVGEAVTRGGAYGTRASSTGHSKGERGKGVESFPRRGSEEGRKDRPGCAVGRRRARQDEARRRKGELSLQIRARRARGGQKDATGGLGHEKARGPPRVGADGGPPYLRSLGCSGRRGWRLLGCSTGARGLQCEGPGDLLCSGCCTTTDDLVAHDGHKASHPVPQAWSLSCGRYRSNRGGRRNRRTGSVAGRTSWVPASCTCAPAAWCPSFDEAQHVVFTST